MSSGFSLSVGNDCRSIGQIRHTPVFLYLDPASDFTHIAQLLDPYSDICSLGNHNKDSARSQIRSTNQYLTLYKHDHLQDLGSIKPSSGVGRVCISVTRQIEYATQTPPCWVTARNTMGAKQQELPMCA